MSDSLPAQTSFNSVWFCWQELDCNVLGLSCSVKNLWNTWVLVSRTLVLQPFFVFFFTNLFVKRTWLQSAMTWDFHVYKNYEIESWSQRQWSSVEPDLWACLFELDQWQQSVAIRSGAEVMNWRTPSPLVMDILSSHWDLWDNWETKYEVQLSSCNIWDISLGIYLWK